MKLKYREGNPTVNIVVKGPTAQKEYELTWTFWINTRFVLME
jgi:hypothetical protein